MKRWQMWLLERVFEILGGGAIEDLAGRAKKLTKEAEARLGAGFGEAKRHQVYAQLIKEFPKVTKREISRAIEDALGN